MIFQHLPAVLSVWKRGRCSEVPGESYYSTNTHTNVIFHLLSSSFVLFNPCVIYDHWMWACRTPSSSQHYRALVFTHTQLKLRQMWRMNKNKQPDSRFSHPNRSFSMPGERGKIFSLRQVDRENKQGARQLKSSGIALTAKWTRRGTISVSTKTSSSGHLTVCLLCAQLMKPLNELINNLLSSN